MVLHTEPDQTLIKMPSLRAVKAFIAAAKYQNFTRAAEALCVTQAAISQRIQQLETELDTPLFRRQAGGIALTEADIQPWLDRRKPGTSRYTTQRREDDAVEILSGVYEGQTTGTPIQNHCALRSTPLRAPALRAHRPGVRRQGAPGLRAVVE